MSTTTTNFDAIFQRLENAEKCTYKPYGPSRDNDGCIIQYKNVDGVVEEVLGCGVHNAAFPSTINGVISAIGQVRIAVPYTNEVTIVGVFMMKKPSLRALSLLHSLVNFSPVGVKLHFPDGTSYPTESEAEVMKSYVPEPRMAKSLELPATYSPMPNEYKDFTYNGKENVTESELKLVKLAQESMMNCYPYSSTFFVGAAFEYQIADGPIEIVTGSNVEGFEHISDGLCAERMAISKIMCSKSFLAKEHGRKDIKIRKGCVVLSAPNDIASPCGACRQVLSEWKSIPMLLLACDFKNKSYEISRWNTTGAANETLLPMSFDLP